MSGRYLLDTNIAIPLMAGDQGVADQLATADAVFMCCVVLGELYFGAHKSARARENLDRVERLAAASTVLSCDAETARVYGRIKDQLRAKGRPIPENDIWLAAVAVQHTLILVTRDDHYAHVEQLNTTRW